MAEFVVATSTIVNAIPSVSFPTIPEPDFIKKVENYQETLPAVVGEHATVATILSINGGLFAHDLGTITEEQSVKSGTSVECSQEAIRGEALTTANLYQSDNWNEMKDSGPCISNRDPLVTSSTEKLSSRMSSVLNLPRDRHMMAQCSVYDCAGNADVFTVSSSPPSPSCDADIQSKLYPIARPSPQHVQSFPCLNTVPDWPRVSPNEAEITPGIHTRRKSIEGPPLKRQDPRSNIAVVRYKGQEHLWKPANQTFFLFKRSDSPVDSACSSPHVSREFSPSGPSLFQTPHSSGTQSPLTCASLTKVGPKSPSEFDKILDASDLDGIVAHRRAYDSQRFQLRGPSLLSSFHDHNRHHTPILPSSLKIITDVHQNVQSPEVDSSGTMKEVNSNPSLASTLDQKKLEFTANLPADPDSETFLNNSLAYEVGVPIPIGLNSLNIHDNSVNNNTTGDQSQIHNPGNENIRQFENKRLNLFSRLLNIQNSNSNRVSPNIAFVSASHGNGLDGIAKNSSLKDTNLEGSVDGTFGVVNRPRKSGSFIEKLDRLFHHNHHSNSRVRALNYVDDHENSNARKKPDNEELPAASNITDVHSKTHHDRYEVTDSSDYNNVVHKSLTPTIERPSHPEKERKRSYSLHIKYPRANVMRSSSETSLQEKYAITKEVLGKGANAVVKLAHKAVDELEVAAADEETEPYEDGDGAVNGGNAQGEHQHHHKKKERLFAVKKFRKRRRDESEKDYIKKLSSEFCISSSLHHENVVETVDLVQDEHDSWYTIMEYCPGGDLFSRIVNGPHPMNLDEINCLFRQLVNGVMYLHNVGVVHRDLKPENLLLSADGKILKIADFGTSEVFRVPWCSTNSKLRGVCGSDPYIAPEQWSTEENAEYEPTKVDIWALGIIYYVMTHSTIPWQVANISCPHYQYFLDNRLGKFEPIDDLSLGPKNMMNRVLDPNPMTRVSLEELTQDAWFKEIIMCNPKDKIKHTHYPGVPHGVH